MKRETTTLPLLRMRLGANIHFVNPFTEYLQFGLASVLRISYGVFYVEFETNISIFAQ